MRTTAALLALGLPLASLAGEIVIREGMAVATVPGTRSMIRRDMVEDLFVQGLWKRPEAGQTLGGSSWAKVKADDKGQFEGAYTETGSLCAVVAVDSPKIMLLEAQGCSMTYVNGTARIGDVYGFGYSSIPVALHKGENELVFGLGRGFLKAKLVDPPAPVSLDPRDSTTPDAVKGEGGRSWAAMVVRNATEEWQKGLSIAARVLPDGPWVRTRLDHVLPLGVLKAPFQIGLPKNPSGEKVEVEAVLQRNGRSLHSARLSLRTCEAGQAHKITFRSRIDGSVQYYAVLPSLNPGPGQALFLSLHGAGVEALGQAQAYGAKTWGHVVCPTNRRPFGFNWEDIGRRDAMEVLALAQASLKTDPRRTFVTGHSMGGHGTWHLAVQYPDRFAGAAPAAGWISYWSYAGGGRYDMTDPLQAELRRASNPSDTLQFIHNLENTAIFIQHGDADDNVPVSEARRMREVLSPWHQDLHWHEEPGQGHWFDTDPEPGASCVDYRPMYDLFAKRIIPLDSSVSEIDFTTASTRINGRCHWVEVLAQTQPFTLSRVKLSRSPLLRTITGTTEGVRRMKIAPTGLTPGQPVKLVLDGREIQAPWPARGSWELEQGRGGWSLADPLPAEKLAEQATWSFKDLYDSRVVFVVGSHGTPEENAWALAKARYDAETLWYIGNGSVTVLTDSEFKLENSKGRNVVLYGHSMMNSCWDTVLKGASVRIKRNSVQDPRGTVSGSYAVMTSKPKPGEPELLVGAVAGTDRAGMERAMRLPLFTAGAGVGASLMLPSMVPQR